MIEGGVCRAGRWIRIGAVGLALVLCAVALGQAPAKAKGSAPAGPKRPSILASAQTQAMRQTLIGKWTTTLGGRTLVLEFHQDGRFTLGTRRGRFAVSPGQVTLTSGAMSQAYQFELANGQLTLKGADLASPLVLTKRAELWSAVSSWFTFSPGSVAGKLWHIVVILIIVIAAQLVIWLAQWISYLAVFSDAGMFGLVYRKRKNRARTIHLLVLNLIKYVIYFSALGLILAEVGVNTTAYLASLSVLGLAIGFGSQGLVQDMVTGFFVLFEGQYDVGDMVDLSGQTGVVSEIGLRMTRLRNYMGQTIVIPNRNVAVVGNYFKGAQAVSIDLALVSTESADLEKARAAMHDVAEQVRSEYVGIVLEDPRAQIIGSDESGRYLRLELAIWPGQSWLVDNQLIPRIREALTAAQLTMVGDRVTAFYHARVPVEQIKMWRWTGLKGAG